MTRDLTETSYGVAMLSLIALLVVSAPHAVPCQLDGAKWNALVDAAVVNSNAVTGRRLGLGLASDAPGGNPKLDVSIAWASLEGKRTATVTAQNAKLGDALQAFWLPGDAKKFYLEKGSVTVDALDVDGKSVTLVLDLVLREGNALRAAKNAGNASHTVTCTLEKVPLVVQP